MKEVDINDLVEKNIFSLKYLKEKIPDNINIVGKIENLRIIYKYNQLDLSRLECDKIYYANQKGDSIKDHILPNSLKGLYYNYNNLTSLPDFTHIDHKLELCINQDLPIKYIPYNTNIELYTITPNKINIEGYPDNPITNQDELDKYMDYIKNYEINRIKSARK